MEPLHTLSARAMVEGVRRKDFSSVELAQAHLDRIEQLNPKLNAFIKVDAEHVLKQARAAEAAVTKGDKLGTLGPLHGVPVSIKSCIEVTGHPYDIGSKLRKGIVGENDAPLVARLRAAGAVILGVTNTPEMLLAYETDNLLYGRTNSPWDLERTPGGSSGGESAAIAAGLSAAGIGSDGGGSIRVPAHFTGLCGLKPTPGRIPATGHFPPSYGPLGILGVVGPITRTIDDLQLLFEVLAGPDPGDVFSSPVPLRPIKEEDANSIRVGYFEDDGEIPVTPETRAAIRTAVKALEKRGFTVEPFFPDGLKRAAELWYTLFGPGFASLVRPMFAGKEDQAHPILQEYFQMMDAEPAFTLETLMSALGERDLVRAQVTAQMEAHPVLLCPVTSVPAFRHREREWEIDGKKVAYLDAMKYSGRFNLLGNPGVSVPAGRSPEGLPIGVQVVARPHEEEAALAVAAVIEQECGGWQAPPLK